MDAGLSAAEMAAIVGVDPATLSRWETGVSRPRSTNALVWVRELDRAAAAKRRVLARREVVYVAAPLSILDDVAGLERALGLVKDRYPDAKLIDGARRFTSNDHWRDMWPLAAMAMHVLVVVPAADGTVGTGVYRELGDARRRGVLVEFCIDGAFLSDDGRVILARIEKGFTSGRAYRVEVG